MTLYRPLLQSGPGPDHALRLAGGWCWFTGALEINRAGARRRIDAHDLPVEVLDRLCSPRAALAGLDWRTPHVMGILNVTPDSFSDGGQFDKTTTAIAHAREMAAAGVSVIDIGGESTRPGAVTVANADEIARVAPVIEALAPQGALISIDTRKADVAQAALDAGARIVNDVSALGYDPQMAATVAASGAPVCLMHAQGTPETMQADPRYEDVVFDVYAALEQAIARAEAAGIPRARILVDPGIGFGKTVDHNLALLRDIAVFHGLGCPILLGVSRKKFIGTLGDAPDAAERVPGTLATTVLALREGVQLHRVHDISAALQALKLAQAVLRSEI